MTQVAVHLAWKVSVAAAFEQNRVAFKNINNAISTGCLVLQFGGLDLAIPKFAAPHAAYDSPAKPP